MTRCKGPPSGCASSLDSPASLSLEDRQAWQLVDGVYPDQCAMIKNGDVRVSCVHMHIVRGAPMHGVRGHTTAQSIFCAHTPSSTCSELHCAVHVEQLSRGSARTCKQGCIKHGKRAFGGLPWLSWTFHRTPLLRWTLPLTVLVVLESSDDWPERNVQFCCPALLKKIPRQIPMMANSYDAHRPRRPQGPSG